MLEKRYAAQNALDSATLFIKLVNPCFFVEATRESGYQGTTHALAELVDNSIQAKATKIQILFRDETDNPSDIRVYILDNGVGMDTETISLALQFGGSTRFNSRDGMGRFGMGLPNASVSQCRRLEVYSRKLGGDIYFTYLDLDEISDGTISESGFLSPVSVTSIALPEILKDALRESGTLVVWKKCDRLTLRNIDGLRKKVIGYLGQAFRNFIYPVENGKPSRLITVNGSEVHPFDPLYLNPSSEWNGGDDRGIGYYDLPVPGHKGQTSRVIIRYSILPVEDWQSLPPKEKFARRIIANRGFSIVRSGREIVVTDRYFLLGQGGQEGRITNNDAWWGCEIAFDPNLDELFGVTHTKQGINPNLQALQRLREDITATVATLRSEYDERRIKKTPNRTNPSEEIVARHDMFLPPAPEFAQCPEEYQQNLDEYLLKTNREGETLEKARERVETKLFTMELEAGKEGPFYRTSYLGMNTIIYINTDHPFYSDLYTCLDDEPDAQVTVELLLFALARGERSSGPEGKLWYQSQRSVWSAALRAYLNK